MTISNNGRCDCFQKYYCHYGQNPWAWDYLGQGEGVMTGDRRLTRQQLREGRLERAEQRHQPIRGQHQGHVIRSDQSEATEWYRGGPLRQTTSHYRTRASARRHASAVTSPYSSSGVRVEHRGLTSNSGAMGAAIARGMKHVKSADGNGNFEACSASGPPSSCVIATHPLPVRVEMALDQPAVSSADQSRHAWNPDDRSLNIFVKENDALSFHRHPVAQSTDCIRGKQGYSSGLHVFEFNWPSRQHGTHAVVGVATREAPLHSAGYQSLVGANGQSWGWDLGRCKAYHNSENVPGVQYPAYNSYQVPDTFLMVLDLDLGTLAFIARGQYLGVAHTGLRGKTVYPIVSSVWGHCEVTMKYITCLAPGPASLASWCRRSIRTSVGKDGLERGDVNSLTLPTAIKEFIMYR